MKRRAIWDIAAMRLSDPEFNRLSLLKTLRLTEPVSRTELAQSTGLNGGTITSIVRDLMERALVIEERVASTGRGRPKLNLRINPEGAYVAGATLRTGGGLAVEIVNLRGERVFSDLAPITHTTRLEDLASQFAKTIHAAIDRSPYAGRIAQVGIGLPAVVDYLRGSVEYFETFPETPFPFADAVERDLGIRTQIDNNINLLARAEHWFGEGAGSDDFSLVLVDLGIGGASYQAGHIHIGSHGIEAELGHVKIVPEGGHPCHCGGLGCLQTYSSVSGIVERYCDLSGDPLPGIFGLDAKCADLAARAISGDKDILALFERAGSYLGRALANHVNMQGPERIIVLFRMDELRQLMSATLLEALHRDTLSVLRNLTDIRFGAVDDGRYARGAAAMVLEQLYRDR